MNKKLLARILDWIALLVAVAVLFFAIVSMYNLYGEDFLYIVPIHQLKSAYFLWEEKEFRELVDQFDALRKYEAEGFEVPNAEYVNIWDQQLDLLWEADECRSARTYEEVRKECKIPSP